MTACQPCINDNHFMMTTTTGGAASVYSALEMWLQTEWSDFGMFTSIVSLISIQPLLW